MIRQRIITHIWMWGIVLAGILSSFFLLPGLFLFPGALIYTRYIAAIALLYLAYHLISSIYYRVSLPPDSIKMSKIIQRGIYGKIVHPTCVSILILSWALFLIYPDVRIFASSIWMAAVIFFWIKIEESEFIKKRKKNNNTELEVG